MFKANTRRQMISTSKSAVLPPSILSSMIHCNASFCVKSRQRVVPRMSYALGRTLPRSLRPAPLCFVVSSNRRRMIGAAASKQSWKWRRVDDMIQGAAIGLNHLGNRLMRAAAVNNAMVYCHDPVRKLGFRPTCRTVSLVMHHAVWRGPNKARRRRGLGWLLG